MLVAQELLEDEDLRTRFADDALQRLREELPLRSSAERLASVASELDRTAPVAVAAPHVAPGAGPRARARSGPRRPARRSTRTSPPCGAR